MPTGEIKGGETVHCVELNSGRQLTGNFKFSQDGNLYHATSRSGSAELCCKQREAETGRLT